MSSAVLSVSSVAVGVSLSISGRVLGSSGTVMDYRGLPRAGADRGTLSSDSNMNLFCFSLEGSMDSLYEAVQTPGDVPPQPVPSRASSRPCSRSVSRSGSPAVALDDHRKCGGSGRSASVDVPQLHTASDRKKRRTNVGKSASDNEALDGSHGNKDKPAAVWKLTMSQEDLRTVPRQGQELRRVKPRTENKGKAANRPGPKKKEKPAGNEVKNTVRRGHKKKPAGKKNLLHSRGASPSAAVGVASVGVTPVSVASASNLDVPLRCERPYLTKSSTLPAPESVVQRRGLDRVSLPGGATPTHAQRWSQPSDTSPLWGHTPHTCRSDAHNSHSDTHTCRSDPHTSHSDPHTCRSDTHTFRRPLTEYRGSAQDVGRAGGRGWEQRGPSPCGAQGPHTVTRSVTDLDLTITMRSTSFGRFDRHQPPSKTEETTHEVTEGEGRDPNKQTGLGKKIKVISLTMRKRIGKKHNKSFSEETGDDTDREAEAEAEGGPVPQNSARSLESLYSGLSCSSGVSESVSAAQRHSLQLEEDGSYQGEFCGRARVHTDFTPSPYDTDSLKLKTGDMIDIIRKPAMGIWTGVLNNKVGNFKFIYVDVLDNREPENEEETPKIRTQRLCRRPRPKTLLELLERLKLEEYASALLLNGYQTVEDLRLLQEKHLIELNVTDPEHRLRLLAAAGLHYAEDDVGEEPQTSLQEEDSDCPRDSGCFIPSECSDSKDDSETQTVSA